MTQEQSIGRGKTGRIAYSLDDIAIIPTRRSRDPRDVSLTWQLDAYYLDIPCLGAPMDSIMSPDTVIELDKLGGLGVLDLEGLWTRYDDPTPYFDQIVNAPQDQATAVMQKIYSAPIREDLIQKCIDHIKAAGVPAAVSLSPGRTKQYSSAALEAGADIFVIRGTTVSAEHVSTNVEPLNLRHFIYDLDVPVLVGGVADYESALHIMRTGAAGVLVGLGGGAASTSRRTLGLRAPMATAIADVAAARRDYMDESGGRYVHVIADGELGTSGSIVKAFALGADAVMLGTALARATEAPGRGMHWGQEAHHPLLPRGQRVNIGTVAPMKQVLFGPSHHADGETNIFGALRRTMATTGYTDVKSFQKCPVIISSSEES